MKTKLLFVLLILIGLGAAVFWFKQNGDLPTLITNKISETIVDNGSKTDDSQQEDIMAIREFMAEPNLELSYVSTDLPMPYFRVGKVTKKGNGFTMEPVDGWVRQVNIYDQKELFNRQCAVYQYHTDARNHTLTIVQIRSLRPNEIDTLKENGVTCISDSHEMLKISKEEAEAIAMGYLKRAVSNFDQIEDQFIYTQKLNGESHEWFWEDKGYKLPEGLSGEPYSYPTIRMTVYGNHGVQYWNTVSLFQGEMVAD